MTEQQPEPAPNEQPAEQPVEPAPVEQPAEQPVEPAPVEQPDAGDVDDVEGERQAAEYNAFEEGLKELPDGYALCPLCIGAGAVPEEPPFDLHKHICGACDGHGETRTGSHVNAEYKLKCESCDGRGWVPDAPGDLPSAPARAREFIAGTARDYAGRTPDDPEFDWARVVRDDTLPPPAPVAEPATVA